MRHWNSGQILTPLAATLILIVIALARPVPATAASGYDSWRHQVESFSVLLTEEQATVGRTADRLTEATDSLRDITGRYQRLVIARNASGASPIDRKHQDSAMDSLTGETTRLHDSLTETVRAATARLELLQSFDSIAASVPQDSPAALLRAIRDNRISVGGLASRSGEQINKAETLLRQVNRLLDKMGKGAEGDGQTLYSLWKQYLFSGKTPVFTLDFWDMPLPGRSWLLLKRTELSTVFATLQAGSVKFLFLFLILTMLGLAAKELLILLPIPPIPEKNRARINFYYRTTVVGAALFFSFRLSYPNSMDSLAALTAGLFLFGVLKLSKHICKDKFLTTCGHTRFAFLFVVSTQLLILDPPNRSATLMFMLIVLSLWGEDTFTAWMRNREQALTATAMRGGYLIPLFAITLFGFGRLACVLTILWCLGVFILAFGSVWAQSLFLEIEKGSKLQKGLARSLLVPLGWALSFTLVYFWLADFFGKSTVDTALGMKATFGEHALYLKDVITLAILFFVTKNAIAAFKVSIEHVGSRWQRAKRGAIPSIQSLVTYAVWSLFSLAALRILGVSLTSLTVIAGGLSVGIGFGLQNVVNNFISGLILLFGRSVQQGDIIEMNGLWCTVKKINIRTTLVETFENAVILIPNSDLATTQLTNWTKNSPTLRRDILIGVAYGSDTRKVQQTLIALAGKHPHVLKAPAPFVIFNDFGASSLDFILRIWLDDIDNSISTLSELRFAIDAAFREADIEIAFPQMDVHLKMPPDQAGVSINGGSEPTEGAGPEE